MPVFEYTGLTEAGKNVRGIRDAESSKVLRQVLRKDGVYLTEARAAEAGAVAGEEKTGLGREVDVGAMLGFTGVSSQDLAIATRQLATLIAAGIPLVEALTALVDQVEQPRLKRIMGAVKQKVNEGSSLADALGEHPKVFSALYVNMIRAGESSGALDVVLVRLADLTESQAQLRNKIIGAMLYPAIMVVVGIAIVGILFVVVIPKVTKIFEDMNVALPWTTRILIAVSSFARDYWYLMLALLPAAVFGIRRWVKTPRGRAWWDRTQLRVPVFGELVRMLALSR
ncbi:MAG TPA: type II secretion system F family protein, partial [Myxococcales bacterium]